MRLATRSACVQTRHCQRFLIAAANAEARMLLRSSQVPLLKEASSDSLGDKLPYLLIILLQSNTVMV